MLSLSHSCLLRIFPSFFSFFSAKTFSFALTLSPFSYHCLIFLLILSSVSSLSPLRLTSLSSLPPIFLINFKFVSLLHLDNLCHVFLLSFTSLHCLFFIPIPSFWFLPHLFLLSSLLKFLICVNPLFSFFPSRLKSFLSSISHPLHHILINFVPCSSAFTPVYLSSLRCLFLIQVSSLISFLLSVSSVLSFSPSHLCTYYIIYINVFIKIKANRTERATKKRCGRHKKLNSSIGLYTENGAVKG